MRRASTESLRRSPASTYHSMIAMTVSPPRLVNTPGRLRWAWFARKYAWHRVARLARVTSLVFFFVTFTVMITRYMLNKMTANDEGTDNIHTRGDRQHSMD